jgi:small multidrug resistance pump
VLTRIPVGITYAIWSGVGMTLISIIGWLFLRQPLNTLQMLCIALIVAGVVGLNLSTRGA